MPEHLSADDIIAHLGFAPLVGEGGYYRETLKVPGDDPAAPRNTAILFLVTPETWSGLHRLGGDELFHFYMGDPCRMVVCSPDGVLEERCLGTDIQGGCVVQTLVPAGAWQGTMLAGDGPHGYALLGTTMTPGFRADEFTLAREQDLAAFDADVAAALRPYLSPTTDPAR